MTVYQAVETGIATALRLIGSRFESDGDPDQYMPFHSCDHTLGVIRRTESLLKAMAVSERDVQLGRLAAAFHDTVQLWENDAFPDGRVIRKKFSGQNETESAAEAVGWMQGTRIFTDQDCEIVRQAILTTVPGWDAENRTVSQPYLTPDAPPVARAVALADLGIAGMDGAAFVKSSDQLFREVNLDIARAIHRCSNPADLSDTVLESYRNRVLQWCRDQVEFARGRQRRLPIELDGLSGTIRESVEALFCRFDEATTATSVTVQFRAMLPPWEVLRATGYSTPDTPGI